jgi:hypothetical protein
VSTPAADRPDVFEVAGTQAVIDALNRYRQRDWPESLGWLLQAIVDRWYWFSNTGHCTHWVAVYDLLRELPDGDAFPLYSIQALLPMARLLQDHCHLEQPLGPGRTHPLLRVINASVDHPRYSRPMALQIELVVDGGLDRLFNEPTRLIVEPAVRQACERKT